MKMIITIIAILILWLSFVYPQSITYTEQSIEDIHESVFDSKYKEPNFMDSVAISAAVYNLVTGNLFTADYIIDTYLPNYKLLVSRDFIGMVETGSKGWASLYIKTGLEDYQMGDVVICAPHDKTDLYTARQAIEIFESDSNVSYMILSGSKRNSGVSADCSHDYNNPFHWMIVEMANIPKETVFIELHGNGQSNCGDYFITNSIRWDLSEEVMMIKQYLQSNNYLMGNCDLWGTTNINGQYINKSVEDQFIHIEQSLRVRKEYNNRSYLRNAISIYLP